MLTENQVKSANYLKIVYRLRHLLTKGIISHEEYERAKVYYKNLTGADIIVAD